MIAALWSKGSARDQATQAARCALAMREVLEGMPVALATGQAARAASGIMGEVIERATKLLRSNPTGGRRSRLVAIDTVTAGLLDVHFDVVGDGSQLGLRRERPKDRLETTRTLLGRPTPFVGREREMGMLDAIFKECCADNVAHAILVTAASGLGKSRLRHEFVQTVRREAKGIEIWVARGDPMSAGSPFGMLAQVVRATAGVVEGETLRTRQAKLSARISRHLSGEDAQRVTEFLGELAGIRFPEAKSVPLQAARRSVVLMGEQMRRAWEDFLTAETAAQPVLLVLEDMHWGDLPTVSFLDGALRRLRETPLMVVATARPEVHQLFPQLWAGRAMTELRLGELSRKAAEKLVRQMVGDTATDDLVERVVDQAAGNAFYLEELIRTVAEGTDGELPGTVIAMVQGRLEGLAPEARRVLRAATVFGERFWQGAVAHLLQDSSQTATVADLLLDLTKREIVQPQENGRYPEEYVFRHAIVREAAYGMLTEDDRVLGHRLAGQWLEGAGETDAMALAEQFERGAEPLRAVAWYRKAAEQALEGNDLSAVLSRAKKGIACGAEGEDKAALRVLQAEAHAWRGEIADSEACGLEAVETAKPGTSLWFQAVGHAATSAGRRGHHDLVPPLVGPLVEEVSDAAVAHHQIVAWAKVTVPLVQSGRFELAEKLFTHIARVHPDQIAGDTVACARILQARALEAYSSADPAGFLMQTEAAIRDFEGAGDLRSTSLHTMNAGYAKMALGLYPAAEVTLRGSLAMADRLGLPGVASAARRCLGMTLALRGALHEARAVETLALEGATQQGDIMLAATCRIYLAEILALARNFDAAERQLLAALDALTTVPPLRAHALGVLGRARLALGRKTEALAASAEAMQLLGDLGTMPEGESIVLLGHAEAQRATGDVTGARATLRDARARLFARSEKIPSVEIRKSFLDKVPSHARTLELAREIGLPSA
jgi:tetratricopeptide (TPR) repeat protein